MPGAGLSRSQRATRPAVSAAAPSSAAAADVCAPTGQRRIQRRQTASARSRNRAASRDLPTKRISSSTAANTAAAGSRLEPMVRAAHLGRLQAEGPCRREQLAGPRMGCCIVLRRAGRRRTLQRRRPRVQAAGITLVPGVRAAAPRSPTPSATAPGALPAWSSPGPFRLTAQRGGPFPNLASSVRGPRDAA